MTSTHASKSAAVRARLNHPVIDSDGHTVEFESAFHDYVKQVAGAKVLEHYLSRRGSGGWYRRSPEERRDHRTVRPPWWTLPWNFQEPGQYSILCWATDEAGRVQKREARWNQLRKNFAGIVPVQVTIA